MYIIDRNKDFYDHLPHIYGVDKKIVYDRRGSTRLDDKYLGEMVDWKRGWGEPEGFLILETGTLQFLIRVYDIKFLNVPYTIVKSIKVGIYHIYNENQHLFSTPMSLGCINPGYRWNWKRRGDTSRKWIVPDLSEVRERTIDRSIVSNPILAETSLTKVLDAYDVYKSLLNYISSLDNDIDVSIPMTDVQKAEVHGFDKKTSFRHPVK